MTEPLLSIQDLTVRYRLPGGGSLTAVNDVSLDIAPSSVVGLVGESGCGKSTLARAVCGLEP
ncbi:ABC transporter ATP-binding protein, partial [Leucobacter sp. OLES1]